MTTPEEKFDKIRLIRMNLNNDDPIQIEDFSYNETDILLKTKFASSIEMGRYVKEFEDRIFFSGDGLAIYG